MGVFGKGKNRACKELLKKNLLTFLIIGAVVLGIVIGLIIRVGLNMKISKKTGQYLGFPGVILIRTLKFVACPLIVACIIVAIGSMNIFIIKTIGWQMSLLVICTKIVSVSWSIILTAVLQPGRRGSTSQSKPLTSQPSTIADIFLDLVRNIIPQNIVEMYLMQYKTDLKPPDIETSDYSAWIPEKICLKGINLLGVIFVTIVMSISLILVQNKEQQFLLVVRGVFRVSMLLTKWIVWAAPLLLFFLILAEILKIEDFSVYATTWGWFLATVIIGHVGVIFLIDPIYVFAFTRTNPFKFYGCLAQALVTAFATASSIVTMPLLIEGLVKSGEDPRLVNFVVPVILNINKDGTATLLAIGTVSIAQMVDADLSFGMYLVILLLCCMGSVATAAVPFAGVVIIIMILSGLGLDQSYAGTLMALYWIIDRCNTTSNVLGGAILTKILAKWNSSILKKLEKKDEKI